MRRTSQRQRWKRNDKYALYQGSEDKKIVCLQDDDLLLANKDSQYYCSHSKNSKNAICSYQRRCLRSKHIPLRIYFPSLMGIVTSKMGRKIKFSKRFVLRIDFWNMGLATAWKVMKRSIIWVAWPLSGGGILRTFSISSWEVCELTSPSALAKISGAALSPCMMHRAPCTP